MRDRILKLNLKEVERCALDYGFALGPLQVAIYVAAGGGMIGRLFAEQPADAYVDARVGRLPYSRKALENMRQTLTVLATAMGYNPHSLPKMPEFHACGVF